MKTQYLKHFALTGLLGLNLLVASAQQDSTQLRKEVEVVKAYTPTISDAYKINDKPQIAAPPAKKPVFDYQIKTQPMITSFNVEPVQAAKMTTEPGEPLNRGLLKLGAGNYMSQYGEFFYNTRAGRNSSIGLHLKSHLSNGKIKLENDDKVKAPDNNNVAEFFTKHDLRSGILQTKLFYERKSFRYYGYTGEQLPDDQKEIYIPMWNEKQAFPKAGVSIDYEKKYDKRAAMNFKTGLKYQYFGSQTGQREHLVNWDGYFTAPIELMEGVLDAGITYSSTDSVYFSNTEKTDKRNQTVLKFNPAAVFDTEVLKFKLGINSYTVFDKEADIDYMLAPNTRIEYMPIKNVLTLYAGTDGYLQQNNYSVIAEENPFVSPDQNIKNTKYRYILTGGIKGKFIPNLSYGLQVDYANSKDQHFYYLQNKEITQGGTTSLYQNNTFDVLYDKVKQFSLGGELHYTLNNEMDIRFQAKYHSYKLDSLQEAWLKPSFESSASFYYDPEGPLRFTADAYFIGKRNSLIQTSHEDLDNLATSTITTSNEVTELHSVIDLNFGVEYQFTNQLSFWGRANNITFQKYELFPGYMNQGLNLLIGASFSF
ncbi:hypothetical protein [Mangrovibacterium lignilyticum]|uniref:hypothetical protein n=1 Tax=Mangrovibacterium lignilyticum TaxID=2668052 RepID=UPI0013D0DAD5|nr:hypothetical protein [Mangrovibacterium lignilyticum]